MTIEDKLNAMVMWLSSHVDLDAVQLLLKRDIRKLNENSPYKFSE